MLTSKNVTPWMMTTFFHVSGIACAKKNAWRQEKPWTTTFEMHRRCGVTPLIRGNFEINFDCIARKQRLTEAVAIWNAECTLLVLFQPAHPVRKCNLRQKHKERQASSWTQRPKKQRLNFLVLTVQSVLRSLGIQQQLYVNKWCDVWVPLSST